jgi:hypothetical protein
MDAKTRSCSGSHGCQTKVTFWQPCCARGSATQQHVLQLRNSMLHSACTYETACCTYQPSTDIHSLLVNKPPSSHINPLLPLESSLCVFRSARAHTYTHTYTQHTQHTHNTHDTHTHTHTHTHTQGSTLYTSTTWTIVPYPPHKTHAYTIISFGPPYEAEPIV